MLYLFRESCLPLRKRTDPLRTSNLISRSLVFACGALLYSAAALAIPIHIGLMGADGHHSWTSDPIEDPHGTLTMSGWQHDPQSGTWTAASMKLVTGGAHDGLGVVCDEQRADNNCSADPADTGKIDTVPWQMIDMDISEVTDWNGLTITLLQDDPSPASYDLWGGGCNIGTGACDPIPLLGCSSSAGTVTCTFTTDYLQKMGATHLWITPWTPPAMRGGRIEELGLDYGQFYLQADLVMDLIPQAGEVPEPPVPGMFGLGLLLVGLFAGRRRRRAR